MILLLVLLLLSTLFLLVLLDARRTFPYVYCNALVSAWEGKMLSPRKMIELSEMDPEAIISALSGTDFEGLELGEEMEEEMRRRCAVKYRELYLNLPKRDRKFFELLLERFEVYNIKALLTSIHTGEPPKFLPPPLWSRERLQLLSQAKNIEALMDFLKGTEYATVLHESLEEYKRKGLLPVLWRLDCCYYKRLWREAQKQRKSVRELVGVEVDLVNLKILLRLKKEGIPPDEIKKFLIRPSYLIPGHLLERAADAEDLSAALQILFDTPYGEVLSRVSPQIRASGSLFPLEREMEEGLLRLCKWYSSSDFFSLAPVVGFFYLKEAELRNLRVLLRLKLERVQPAECRKLLVSYEV